MRVRDFGDRAAIEVAPEGVGRLLGHPRLPELIETLREMGWGEVEVDLQGYRQGRMNVLT